MDRTAILVVIPWLIMVGYVVWYSGDRDRRIMGRWLRGRDETSLQAIREWFKALGFLVASIAAVFAFWQFDIANRRSHTDLRPWISTSPVTARDIEIGPDGLTWSLAFTVKNTGLTPGLNVAVGQNPMIMGQPFYPAEFKGKACSDAEQRLTAITVFPRDEVPWGAGASLPNAAIETFLKANETNIKAMPDFSLAPLIAVCIAYRSTLDDQFHHTAYLLQMQIDGGFTASTERTSKRPLTGYFREMPWSGITSAD